MQPALSIILPVHNAQRTLANDLRRLFEVAEELVPSLEVIVVDNGSRDDTFETAHELAARFPQLCVIRIANRLGVGAAIQQATQQARGTVVLAHDGVSAIEPEQLAQSWLGIRSQPVARQGPGDLKSDTPGRWLSRYLRWAEAHQNVQRAHHAVSGFQLVQGAGAGRRTASPASPPRASKAVHPPRLKLPRLSSPSSLPTTD